MKKLLLIFFNISLLWAASDPKKNIQNIITLNINSSINTSTLDYLEHSFKKVKNYEAPLVLIKLNTPGGFVTTTKDIMTLIGDVDFPVVIWITPEGASATSAGAIISSSAHFLFMSEGTNIGAATPIGLGKDIEQKDAKSKAVNDLVALTQSLSEARGRDPIGFGKMISEAKSYKTQEALKLNLINGVASHLKDIKKYISTHSVKIKGKTFQFEFAEELTQIEIEMEFAQKILNIFANPSTAYILFLLGAALLYLEFQAPGGFIAGSIGALCLVLAAIAFQVLPLNMGAFALIVLAFMLFVLEAYITSYGLLSLAGLVSLTIGSLFLFRSESGQVQIETSLILSAVLAIAGFMGLIAYMFIKDLKKNRPTNFFTPSQEPGEIVKILSQEADGHYLYQVKAHGTLWKAKSSEQFSVGEKIFVQKSDSNQLVLEISKP